MTDKQRIDRLCISAVRSMTRVAMAASPSRADAIRGLYRRWRETLAADDYTRLFAEFVRVHREEKRKRRTT